MINPVEAMMHHFFGAQLPDEHALSYESREIGGVPTWVLTPTQVPEQAPIFIDIHGGGLYLGGGELAWKSAAAAAAQRPGITFSPDYRMPPKHVFPAPVDDCLALYLAAVELVGADKVVVIGTSAGGNLAAASLLKAKEQGAPMPAGLVLLSPEIDLTESGDTFNTNNGVDYIQPMPDFLTMYADGEDLTSPHLSPLFGDLTDFPPTFLQSGTRDLFLSNTVRMHRALRNAGVPAELHVWEAMPHGGFGGTTAEDYEVSSEARAFERRCLGAS